MSTTRTSDCRKFSPNIFNKSKCSHCFRQREEHSAAALECNRASRKVSKCGYLFVAPDWDFSNPLYRTKRWQRRWFVLYDDGELTYSVDEHPETVPQACIDMTKVLEVAMAEDVTGHTNSIAITAPDRVTFVKGTCPEESKWWLNILAAFPKSKGRHKRNATFPGGQATTTILQQMNADAYNAVSGVTAATGVPKTRNRHNSYHKDALTSVQSTSVLIGGGGNNISQRMVNSVTTAAAASSTTNANDDDDDEDEVDDDEDDGVETGEDEDEEEEEVGRRLRVGDEVDNGKKELHRLDEKGCGDSKGSNSNKVPSSCLLIEDIRRDEKTFKDIANTITNLSQQQKNRWSNTTVNNVLNSHNLPASATAAAATQEKNSRDETDYQRTTINKQQLQHLHHHQKQQQQQQQQQQPHKQSNNASLRPKSLPLAANSTPAIVSAIVKKIPPVLLTQSSNSNNNNNKKSIVNNGVISTNDGSGSNKNNNSTKTQIEKGLGGGGGGGLVLGLGGGNKSKSSPRLQLQLKNLQQKHESNQHRQQQHLQQQQSHSNSNKIQMQHQEQNQHQRQHQHERGDPDGGCNLDDLSTNYLAKTAELRVNPPAEESLNTKKGWLMKQDNRTGDWTKHWFSLSGAALFYYRDPVSEERGVLDGVLDVNSLTNVAEVSASKNYAFQLTSWDQRRLILSSLTPSSRNSWIAVLRNIAGLPALLPVTSGTNNGSAAAAALTDADVPPTVELVIKDGSSSVAAADAATEIEKDFIKAQRNHDKQKQTPAAAPTNSPVITPPQLLISAATASNAQAATAKMANAVQTPTTPKSAHFSSDDEYRTASEGGRRDSVDWGSSPLTPSPPIITTPIMRNRERLYARSIGQTTTTSAAAASARTHKRSHSSPPTSRRSTVDSVGSDELAGASPVTMQPVQEELHIDKELQFRLSVAEKEREMLRGEAKERETRMSELLTTMERTEQQLNTRLTNMEAVRDDLRDQLAYTKRNAENIVESLTEELQLSQNKIKYLEDRLARGIDENEALYKRVHELEGSSSLSSFSQLNRGKLKRLDSLSDLTQIGDIDPYALERDSLAEEYNELRSRFEKAVNEIRAMKRELKESQNQFDSLELSYAALKQDLERKGLEDRAQVQMMAARIQDLTLKYSSSERQVRTLKQKMAKTERRRSLSLKGKEQLSIPKELELKVCELEAKIDEMEKCNTTSSDTTNLSSATSKKSARRRSLESNASHSNNSDPIQFMLRLNDLEKRLEDTSAAGSVSSSSTPTPSCQTPTLEATARHSSSKVSDHLMDRLRCLESVLVTSRDRLEQSLHQLHNLRSSHSRRSVSPITDRKDSYRFVERSLSEVVKLIRESCETCVISGGGERCTMSNVMFLPDSNPVKVAITQLESQLRTKLGELLKQRRVLRERNELTERKNMELLAERVAFESVCFGKLRDSVTRAENPELFGERQTRAEVAETSHLIAMLKSKLSGKCALKSPGSLEILAGVLARRLMLTSYLKVPANGKESLKPVNQNIMDDLLRQQNEINLIAKRYKNNAMENVASGLAAETLSYISANDLVQGAVQEAWRQAQETVNAELVQAEIAHIMLRNAERFENSLTPSFGYTLTAEERLSFERFADAVHDALRKEMELAVAQLTQSYKEAIKKMKHGQWRMQLEQERKVSEGRQLLSEFADVIAHKALVDARIAVLRGEYVEQQVAKENIDPAVLQKKPGNYIGITALQRYESLFEELSNDLHINNPADILADADFEFIYKQHTIDFLNDRQVLSEISTFLSQLEDSLIALQCEASASTTSIPRSTVSIESLQDVCHKCGDLRQRADQLCQEIHRALNTPCQHCRQVHEKLVRLQQQHESELVQLQQAHAKDMSAYLQQLENQRNAFKQLEAEKEVLRAQLQRANELMEQRANELATVNAQLHTKEQELRTKQTDQTALLRRCEEQAHVVRTHEEQSRALMEKCARQDEEYAVLLQERDYLQAELNKEKERSRCFERRLEMLELEHNKQLECLQETYRDQLMAHSPADFSNAASDDESFRQRYQAEIEQLRTLCEKGLSAMESTHRRIIADLEENHRQEIERLLLEKETALAEETQATLAALDAMRKAHQSEVQREVARFKQEFLKQFQKGEHSTYPTKANEEELEELRREILSFSEKFSIKCVENATLEEKLRSTMQKLRQLQQMQQLELRNKQFRAHLASEDPATDANFVQGLTEAKDDGGNACEDSESKLQAHVKVHDLTLESAIDATTNINPMTTTTTSMSVMSATPLMTLVNSKTTSDLLAAPRAEQTPPTGMSLAEQQISPLEEKLENIIKNTEDNNKDSNIIGAHVAECIHDNVGDGDDNDDDDDDDEFSASFYTYEPCYKQSNLYSFQSRLSFEGLKSSTFGKKLRKTTRKRLTNVAIPESTAATTSAAPKTTTITPTSKSSPTSSSNAFSKPHPTTTNAPAVNMAEPSATTTTKIMTDRRAFECNQKFSMEEEEEEIEQNVFVSDVAAAANTRTCNSHNLEIATTTTTANKYKPTTIIETTTTTTITKPVEQPKISSANKYNYNRNSNNENNKNKSNNIDNNTNTFNISNINENKIISEQSNNNNINNINSYSASMYNNNNTNNTKDHNSGSGSGSKNLKQFHMTTFEQRNQAAAAILNVEATTAKKLATVAELSAIKNSRGGTRGHMCVAERSKSISLNSFTDFVRKTTTTTTAQTQIATSSNADDMASTTTAKTATNIRQKFDYRQQREAEFSDDGDESDNGGDADDDDDDDDDVGGDRRQQQQRKKQHRVTKQQISSISADTSSCQIKSSNATTTTTITKGAAATLLGRTCNEPTPKLPPTCSPTSGSSGSDVVEQTKMMAGSAAALSAEAPLNNQMSKAMQKKLRQFELET